MSDAADKLARTRLAIIAHLQARERHHERREPPSEEEPLDSTEEAGPRRHFWNRGEPRARTGRGWLGQARHVVRTWWRHHPASMGVDLARPVLASYATRKPVQYVAIAAGLGAALVLLRPWRVMSATGLIVALVKSSQLPSLVMSAMAGADYGHDDEPPV
jgi:hypothetical protein